MYNYEETKTVVSLWVSKEEAEEFNALLEESLKLDAFRAMASKLRDKVKDKGNFAETFAKAKYGQLKAMYDSWDMIDNMVKRILKGESDD